MNDEMVSELEQADSVWSPAYGHRRVSVSGAFSRPAGPPVPYRLAGPVTKVVAGFGSVRFGRGDQPPEVFARAMTDPGWWAEPRPPWAGGPEGGGELEASFADNGLLPGQAQAIRSFLGVLSPSEAEAEAEVRRQAEEDAAVEARAATARREWEAEHPGEEWRPSTLARQARAKVKAETIEEQP